LLMTKKEKRFVPSPETFPVFSFTLYSDTKMETRNVINPLSPKGFPIDE